MPRTPAITSTPIRTTRWLRSAKKTDDPEKQLGDNTHEQLAYEDFDDSILDLNDTILASCSQEVLIQPQSQNSGSVTSARGSDISAQSSSSLQPAAPTSTHPLAQTGIIMPDSNAANQQNGEDEAEAASTAACKLPPFWRTRLTLWFRFLSLNAFAKKKTSFT